MKNYTLYIGVFFICLVCNACYQSSGTKTGLVATNTHQSHKQKAGNDSVAVSEEACLIPIAAGDTFKYISKSLEVKGDVEHQLSLTVDSLKKMKSVVLNNLNVVCQSGAVANTKETRKGVLLKDILEKAAIIQKDHKDRNFIIVARATDNYKATFSWAEIFNNPTGENTLVLYEEDGKPITSKGEFKLVCASDIKTGPRQVIWLKSIEVTRVN